MQLLVTDSLWQSTCKVFPSTHRHPPAHTHAHTDPPAHDSCMPMRVHCSQLGHCIANYVCPDAVEREKHLT